MLPRFPMTSSSALNAVARSYLWKTTPILTTATRTAPTGAGFGAFILSALSVSEANGAVIRIWADADEALKVR